MKNKKQIKDFYLNLLRIIINLNDHNTFFKENTHKMSNLLILCG